MQVKPHAKITKRLSFLLKATIVFWGTVILFQLYVLYYYLTMPKDTALSDMMPDIPDIMYVIATIMFLAFLVILLVATINFFMWVYRSNKNLRILSGKPMKYSPAWSFWSFIIPIVNLFAPYKVIKEIWDVSHKTEETSHSIITLWWSTFLISDLVLVLFSLLPEQSVYGELVEAMTTSVLFLVVNILTLDIVTKIGKAYSRNIEEV